jgi:hypothetical protein
MTYVAPTTHVAGETLPAADWNVVVNDIISHEARMGLQSIVPTSVAVSSGSATTSTNGAVTYTTVSASGTVTLNGVFSSAYTNYRVIVQNNATSSTSLAEYRLAASGTASTASDYSTSLIYVDGSTVYGDTGALANAFAPNATSRKNSYYILDFFNPFVATQTGFLGQIRMSNAAGADAILHYSGGVNQASTSYDGIQIILLTDESSGHFAVYGYNT